MLTDLMNMGPFTWPLLLIAVANLAQIVWRASQIGAADAADRSRLRVGIDAIFFWGGVALLLGFLGQYGGLYVSMNGVATLESVGHGLIAKAIAETVMPAIVGMFVLFYSFIGWYLLRARLRAATPAMD